MCILECIIVVEKEERDTQFLWTRNLISLGSRTKDTPNWAIKYFSPEAVTVHLRVFDLSVMCQLVDSQKKAPKKGPSPRSIKKNEMWLMWHQFLVKLWRSSLKNILLLLVWKPNLQLGTCLESKSSVIISHMECFILFFGNYTKHLFWFDIQNREVTFTKDDLYDLPCSTKCHMIPFSLVIQWLHILCGPIMNSASSAKVDV